MGQRMYESPPYCLRTRESLLQFIIGLPSPITVCEDLFYALLWERLCDQQTPEEDRKAISEINMDELRKIRWDIDGTRYEIVKG